MIRSQRVTVRLSDEELARLEALSSAARMPISTYLRENALEGNNQVLPNKFFTELRVELDRARLEVGLLKAPALQRAINLLESKLQ